MRSVGLPFDTGTPCPSLPHTPSRVSKSSATASMADRMAGPLPMRFAPRTGAVIRPVLDQVPLGHAEHEVARGRVHLAAAERLAYSPRGVSRPPRRSGGLAAAGWTSCASGGSGGGVGLPAAVAGRGHAVVLGPTRSYRQPTSTPSANSTVRCGGRPLVVDGDDPHAPGTRAVVDPGHQRRGQSSRRRAPR